MATAVLICDMQNDALGLLDESNRKTLISKVARVYEISKKENLLPIFIRVAFRADPDTIVLTKIRVGSFSTTPLAAILKANNVSKLVLCGVSTSGVILTTVREAADMDYAITVLSDGCLDRTADVHEFLLKNVFPRQATIMTVDEWIALSSK